VTTAAELARDVSAARARLIGFVGRCPRERWASSPLADSDPRTVAVIVDHVADAYEYLGSWVAGLARGEPAEVTPAVVDELNARHAAATRAPSRESAIEHLLRSGDAFVALIESLGPEQLSADDGRITRFAEIAARHADSHRADLESVLGLAP
jgi:hypothetical protein